MKKFVSEVKRQFFNTPIHCVTDEVVLGVTTGGWVKVWTVSEREVRPREPIFEHESKMIHSLNALGLVCCTYNQRTVLMVSQEDWQVCSTAL